MGYKGPMDLTTVADDHAVVHDGLAVRRYDDLEPDTVYEFDGFAFRTLARPAGERLATFATVNDVHFGEVVCGIMDGIDLGPTFSVTDGEEPYPETMNRGAIHEIELLDPDLVLVKGDLTAEGTDDEYRDFLEFYGEAFGDRLVHTRGNHDVHGAADFASEPTQRVDLPGAVLAVVDTSVRGQAGGHVTGEQLEWLHDLAADTDLPVYVFGHHNVWSPDSVRTFGATFGIDAGVVGPPHRGRGRPAQHPRLLRRPHPSQPGPPHLHQPRRAVGRGGVREGLPGRVGRVPGVRGRVAPGLPPHLHPGRPGVVGEDPGHVRGDVLRLQLR